MSAILLINDGSEQSFHAGQYALILAKQLKKNIILANMVPAVKPATVTAGIEFQDEQTLADRLNLINRPYDDFHPVIRSLNAVYLNEKELVSFINQQQISLTILASGQQVKAINLQGLLGKVLCPLLLLPSNFDPKPIERMMYLTDLRFCQVPVLNYLARMTDEASIHIAHLCTSGLPELATRYANDIFDKTISPNMKSSNLFFSHIRENDIHAAVDTMIHAMHADLLICQHKWFHFKQLLGENIPVHMPEHVSVPLLVFPS